MNPVSSMAFKHPAAPRFGVLKVGLTGGIASGKSLVGQYLNELGVKTLDADDVTHQLLQGDVATKAEIRAAFGDGVFAADGGVDRKKLGAIVFADAKKRERLEAIVHPRVRQQTEAFFEANKNEKLAVAIVPLIFEKNLAANYDSVWFVKATKKQQVARLCANRGMTRTEAEDRLKSQMGLRDKLKALKKLPSWAVIDNTGSVKDTQKQVSQLVTAV